jgi:hypothetical protein
MSSSAYVVGSIYLATLCAFGCGSEAPGADETDPTGTAGDSTSVTSTGSGGSETMMLGGGGRGGGTFSSAGQGGGAGAVGGGGSVVASKDAGTIVDAGLIKGDGSSPPHVVGKCDKLGAVGEFEIITPPQITPAADALSVFVAVNPQNPSIVYTSAGTWTGARGFFRSNDCGSTWTKLDSGRNSKAINSGFQWIMAVEPANGDVVYAVNGYGSPPTLYKSTNAGVDWDPMFPDGGEVAKAVGFTQSVSMDPTDSKHLVVSFHENCKGTYAPMCMAESTDAGATWRLFRGPGDGWIEGAAPVTLGPTTFLFSSAFGGTYYTNDKGATWEKVATSGGEQVYQAGDGTMYLGSGNGVMKSVDHGHRWTPIPKSPVADGLIGNGTRIFATATANTGGHPFYNASESDPTTWTNMQGTTFKQGGSHLAYDPDHHILYSSNYQGGLSRVVVQ